MTENSATQNQEKNPIKKRASFFTKFIVFLALVFSGYFGFKYWQSEFAKRVFAKKEVEKYDNLESEIFDLSGGHEGQKSDTNFSDLHEMNVNELKEKGAEFIYQMLLKNQIQLNDLNQEIQSLKTEILKYKNREKIAKMILAYVDLRQEIFSQKSYESSFKNFEIITISDENLSSKVVRLKTLLPTFSNQEKLVKTFAQLIPDLVVTKNNKVDSSIISKVRRNISKLVIIRRIGGKDSGDVDSVIFKTEKFLNEENYQEALNSLLSLDQNYHEIIKDFLNDLTVAIEVQKIDQEILNYLKNLA